jgi:hypothetical protein
VVAHEADLLLHLLQQVVFYDSMYIYFAGFESPPRNCEHKSNTLSITMAYLIET